MGRVEIMNNGTWGTVCDDEWDDNDAAVVCSMLGFSRENAVAKKEAFFGAGSGTIWMDEVECTGTEVNLFQCPKSELGVHNCGHSEDSGVVCSLDTIRLVNGSLPYQGRVEIKHNGVWGTVCDDGWDKMAAAVVCFMLGFPRNFATAKSGAFYGQGSGKIWIDDISCSGHESNILHCNSSAIGKHNCQHSEDAGVICLHAQNIRLVNGYTAAMGRVEIKNSGTWGTVCDDEWDDNDAAVVCSMLGFSRENAVAKKRAFFGPGHGTIWMDQVECRGTEINLFQCPKSALGEHDCTHGEDAAVICSLDTIRLVNGSLPYEGRVEIKHNGVWGTVCDDGLDKKDAAVVCSMLGFPRNFATAKSNAFYGQGSGKIWIDDISCGGHESNILQCNSSALGTHNCQHSEDAGVLCSPVQKVRLLNGYTTAMGRVEIQRKGAWGTICDNDWDDNEAAVVCSMLGFSRKNAVARNGAFFGPGQGPIWMDDVKCTGSEANLFQCPKAEIGDHICVHSKDSGVSCSLDIRLVNGSSAYEGRVEVKFNDVWGTVCDDYWDNNDAAVICGMLGFSRKNAVAKRSAFFGKGKGIIWMDDVECGEDDRNIAHCKKPKLGTENCIHSEDAGVICVPGKY
ncbi:deleted in malignant brain tumors 1 protein-like [Saccostrea echinata]|uniref:deleted in malignant brain tumors 1 protein-like n=1 Tax=Saccostrea echinata TaxID=191078 RepID=UPI002A81720E|nr:deleted in malignant brain tumors 1 protein-like [Saccostrea echinata]